MNIRSKEAEAETLQVLTQLGAVIVDSHIVLKSGKHASAYVNKDAIYPYTTVLAELCTHMAQPFKDSDIDVVVGPALGGVPLSQWVSFHLTNLEPTGQKKILAVYAEKDGDDKFIVKRGQDKLLRPDELGRQKRVLIVEDILTTGGSVKKVVEALSAFDACVVGAVALVNRGGVTAEAVGVPELVALANVKLDSWEEADCPLCRAGVAVNVDVGHGREFLAKHPVRLRAAENLKGAPEFERRDSLPWPH